MRLPNLVLYGRYQLSVPSWDWEEQESLSRDCLLLRKIGTFLLELNSISAVDREAFVQQMDKDPAERDKIGVHLMVLLDRFEEFEKAQMLGKLFCAYLQRKLSRLEFLVLGRAIDRCLVLNLQLVGTTRGIEFASEAPFVAADYQAAGLIQLKALGSVGIVKPTYEWTHQATQFNAAVVKEG